MTLDQWLKQNDKTGRWMAERLEIEEAQLSRIRHKIINPSLHIANRIVSLTHGEVTVKELDRE